MFKNHFFCEFYDIFWNGFFIEQLCTAASLVNQDDNILNMDFTENVSMNFLQMFRKVYSESKYDQLYLRKWFLDLETWYEHDADAMFCKLVWPLFN